MHAFRKPLLKSGIGPALVRVCGDGWHRGRRAASPTFTEAASEERATCAADVVRRGSGGCMRDKVAVRQTTHRQNFFGSETRAYLSESGTRSQ